MTLADIQTQSRDYERIEQAIHNLEEMAVQQPDLKRLAASLKLSEFHFQRMFSRWAAGKRMNREHRGFFSSAKEAQSQGYRPCGNCLQREYVQWIYLRQ